MTRVLATGLFIAASTAPTISYTLAPGTGVELDAHGTEVK